MFHTAFKHPFTDVPPHTPTHINYRQNLEIYKELPIQLPFHFIPAKTGLIMASVATANAS